MGVHPNSPNALWAKHGYTVQRQQRRLGGPKIRIIRDPSGDIVLHDVGYGSELKYIKHNLEKAAL